MATIEVRSVPTIELGTSGGIGSVQPIFASGPTGPTGPTGATGPAPNLNTGTVSTLGAGVPATASVSGANPNYLLNLGIPTGPTGAQGLPGPGSAAWTAAQAVTVGSVRQAPDGSWIKATANRTTGATFDATEQTFWTAVLATAGTIEKAALDAGFERAESRTVHVRQYGAVGDGVTDDRAAFVSALAAASTVLLDAGDTYLLAFGVPIGAGQTIRCASGKSTLKSGAANDRPMVTMAGGDTSLINVILDGNNATNVAARPLMIGGARVTVTGCEIKNSYQDGVNQTGVLTDLTITDNYIHDCRGAGISLSDVAGGARLNISRNTIRQIALAGTGGVGIQLYSAGGTIIWRDVHVDNNTVTDLNATGIPVEVTGAQRGTMSGNIISGVGTRGLSCILTDFAVMGNSISDQTLKGIELGIWKNCVVSGNVIRNCFIAMEGSACDDLTIVGNTIHTTTDKGILLQGTICKRLIIRGNTFVNTSGDAVSVANASEDVVVSDNTFIYNSAATPIAGTGLVAISIYGWQRADVCDNTIHTAVSPGTAGAPIGLIQFNTATCLDVRVRRNRIRSTATPASPTCGVAIRTTAAPGTRIEFNDITGMWTGIYTDQAATDNSVVVNENMTATCTTPQVLGATHRARTQATFSGTAIPTVNTWAVGDEIKHSAPAVGSPKSWLCTVAGTPGTWVSTGNL